MGDPQVFFCQPVPAPPPPTRVCSKRGWCLLVVPILIAPRFHPMSSCSWRRLGVLSWWWSSGPPCRPALVVVVLPSLSSSCPCRRGRGCPALIIVIVEGGGGRVISKTWWVYEGRGAYLVPGAVPSSIVVSSCSRCYHCHVIIIIIPPAIHPTSSCS